MSSSRSSTEVEKLPLFHTNQLEVHGCFLVIQLTDSKNVISYLINLYHDEVRLFFLCFNLNL